MPHTRTLPSRVSKATGPVGSLDERTAVADMLAGLVAGCRGWRMAP